MAYKFQLGAAVLSGSINVADGAISGSAVSDTLAASIISEIDAGEIPITKLASSTISGVSLGGNLNSLSRADNGGLNGSSYNGSAAVSNLQIDHTNLVEYTGSNIANGDLFSMYDLNMDVHNKVSFQDMANAVFTDVRTAGGTAVQIASGGKATIVAGAVSGSHLGDTVISGQTELAATADQADELLISDGGTLKKITISNLEDTVFGNVSGDATVAAGGVLTIEADAVEHSMLNDNCISGFDNLGSAGVAQADEFLFSDAGTLKALTFSNLEDSIFGNISKAATVAAGGALTIAAGAVSGSHLGDTAISGLTEMTGDLADTDELMVSDAGTLKRADFSVVRDAIFADVSGDAAVAAGGALTIAANAVEGSMLNSNAAGTGLVYDSNTLAVSASQTAISSIYNAALIVGRGASDAHIDFGTDDQIQFDIDNTATMNLSSNGINVQQGGIQVPAGADIDAGGAGAVGLFESIGANTLTLAGTGSTVVIPGNLHVSGSTISIDSATIAVSSSFTFEGPVDDHETTLTCGTPTADTTLNLPTLGAGTYHIPVLADAATAASAAVTAAEFALLDGGSSVGTDGLAATDGFLHNDGGTMKHTQISKIADFFAGDGLGASSGVLAVNVDDSSIETSSDSLRVKALGITNAMLSGSIADSKLSTISTANKVSIAALNIAGADDIASALAATDLIVVDDGAGGTIRKAAVSRIASYVGTNLAVNVDLKDDGDVLAVGVNYFADLDGGGESVTLPASAGMSTGQSVKIKAPSNCSAANPLTINRAGSQTIDGVSSIALESPFAAVELVYVATDTWRVF